MQAFNPKELCGQIRNLYPEVGECGVGVEVYFDEIKTAWIVGLEVDGRHLSTHLEVEDALACMEGEQCVALGAQIGQLVANLKSRPPDPVRE
jgi:hypothetical protein